MNIYGLGNPGVLYRDTRHNVGFMVIDRIAKDKGLRPTVKGNALIYKWDIHRLIKPMLYMNNSGIVCRDIQARFPSSMLVVYDDFYLPLGSIRIRKRGGDGGHKGISSIIYVLETEDIPRIRLGIGPISNNSLVKDFVLKNFLPEEKETVEQMINTAVEAIETIVNDGLEKAMNKFNAKRRVNEI